MITFLVHVDETDEAFQIEIESDDHEAATAELLLAVGNTFSKAAVSVAAGTVEPARFPVLS